MPKTSASREAVCTERGQELVVQDIIRCQIPPAHLQDALTDIQRTKPFQHVAPFAIRVLNEALQRTRAA